MFLCTLQICYNSTSNFVFAASRDRSLYGWKWPIEGTGCTTAIEEKPSQTVEPITILQGHSLGVTALDCNNGGSSSPALAFEN